MIPKIVLVQVDSALSEGTNVAGDREACSSRSSFPSGEGAISPSPLEIQLCGAKNCEIGAALAKAFGGLVPNGVRPSGLNHEI
jgi:hypothetical protein